MLTRSPPLTLYLYLTHYLIQSFHLTLSIPLSHSLYFYFTLCKAFAQSLCLPLSLSLATFKPCDVSLPLEPLPILSATVLDYSEAPETGVVFHIQPPPATIFSRVNISYSEGAETRAMLYRGLLLLQGPERTASTALTAPT